MNMEGINDVITCKVCYDVFNVKDRLPKCLPCSHTFCLRCMDKITRGKGAFSEYLCPLCKTKYQVPPGGAPAIPTNVIVRQLCEDAQVKKSTFKCRDHNESSNFVCTDCCDPLCDNCVLDLAKDIHRNHHLEKIQSFVGKLKQEAQGICDEHEKLVESSKKNLQDQHNDLIAAAKEKAKRARRDIDDWLDKTIKSIEYASESRKVQDDTDRTMGLRDSVNTTIDQGNLNKTTINIQRMKIMLKIAKNAEDKVTSSIGGLTENYQIDMGYFTEVKIEKTAPSIYHLYSSEIKLGCVNSIVGMGKHGVLIAREDLLTFLGLDNYYYDIDWGRGFPVEITTSNCRKYFLPNQHILVQNNDNGEIIEFSGNPDMNLIKKHKGGIGTLIGASSSNHLVCADKACDYQISFYKYPSLEKCLTLDVEMKYKSLPSVCVNPVSGHMAVAAYGTETMVIYNNAGKPLHKASIQSRIGDTGSSLAATARFILVMVQDPVMVGVYNWEGRHLTSLLPPQLLLHPSHRHNLMLAIASLGEDRLVIAVWDAVKESFELKQFLID